MADMKPGSVSKDGHATKLIELRDEFASVAIAPEVGGSLSWFRWTAGDKVIDWLRPADATALFARNPAGMACFPLVPFSNRVRGGRFEFKGQSVQLPATKQDPHFEHGHGWRQPWTLISCEASSATLRYRHEPDQWPWQYEARQEISLSDGTLEVRLSLLNLAKTAMPFGFGFHPFFSSRRRAPDRDRDGCNVGGRRRGVARAVIAAGRQGQPIDVAGSNLDNVFSGWSRRAHLVWPDRRLEIEADAPLDFLVIYTPAGESYFCAEPVSNATDAFNFSPEQWDETGHRVLEAGESCSATVRFMPHAIV